MSAIGARPRKVLIAARDPAERARLARLLHQTGYETVEVEDGPTALAALRREGVDVALLEMGTPGMNSKEVIKEARRSGQDVPILLLADAQSIALAEEAMKLGADNYLTKPVWKDDLLSSIDKACHTRPARPETVSPGERAARLRQQQRMEVLGQLTSGVAHDLNNLITVMLGYSQILQHYLDPESPLRTDLVEIQKAGDRAAALTRQLLAFSRKQEPQPVLIDLNQLVANMEPMLRRLIREDIEMVTVLQPEMGRAKADPGQIEQVLMNLVLNARDAMPRGGQLNVETAAVVVDRVTAERHPELGYGCYLTLTVRDTGCGMDRATLGRIFEPFFTTKDYGRGTGLGLYVVRNILEQSGGSVAVASEPGRGSTFTVYLPQAPAGAAEPGLDEHVLVPPPRGWETVLVVEDNDNIRSLVREILRRSGYTVLEARHGPEALELCRQHGDAIHLLVSDVVIPQMGARELADRLTGQCPALKVLYMSGYAPPELEHYEVLTGDTPFIEKPFLPEAFARKVREILDR